ncbi:ATP-dependent protease [Arenimonas soli]|uniref:ATP-dependent protease n=1 Tax=Arenimonas soli TaxID=2269504 RepID=A0ABQ1HLI7_9GAMM|nr:YifB family Mg chelatase-like AAA ATPase [Arenimonas soli]GGA82429.1 ATP-dependent protease [Arenimonas soli]
MNLALAHSRARVGVLAPAVRVEAHLGGGLPNFTLVGMPATAVRESRERVRSAIGNAQFEFPQRRITVNLAPADLPKEGGRYDLAIALGLLAASGQVPVQTLGEVELLGELALTGELKPVDGVLPAALAAAREGRPLVVPAGNGAEAALASGGRAYVARTLLEVCAHLRGEAMLPLASAGDLPLAMARYPDLADVRGQGAARRALEVAAAGAHALLLIGPPGCGKTLLASRLPGLLPDPDETEALETAAIHSVSGQGLDLSRWRQRPYRSPHHLASAVALVGGGSNPRPGEVSLAHNGVLFLDELAEWSRQALETLRQPMESGRVIVSRAARQSEFPASFQLVAAMNPCPCAWAGDPSGRCGCSAESVARYRAKLSGPLLDRIDLQLAVPRLPPSQLRPDQPPGESTAVVRARVLAARARQLERAGVPNARLDQTSTDRDCVLRPHDRRLLERAIDQLQLSARALHRIQRVARTLADLGGEDAIRTEHVAEAIGYRLLDRAGPPA